MPLDNSFSLGSLTPFEPSYCIAIGTGAETGKGNHNIVLGTSTVFEGEWNIVIGCYNKVRGSHNVVIGDNIEVNGDHQTVINGLTEADLFARENLANTKWDLYGILSSLNTYAGYHQAMHKAYEILNGILPTELAKLILEHV